MTSKELDEIERHYSKIFWDEVDTGLGISRQSAEWLFTVCTTLMMALRRAWHKAKPDE